jgi:hypothetical protein
MQAEPRQAFIRDMLKHGKKYKYRFFSKQENLYAKTILYAQQQMIIPKRDDEAPKERLNNLYATAWYIMTGNSTVLCRC